MFGPKCNPTLSALNTQYQLKLCEVFNSSISWVILLKKCNKIQNLPQSSKRHELSEISYEDDEISADTRPYGISDSEQPDDVVSIPDQRTMRQQI